MSLTELFDSVRRGKYAKESYLFGSLFLDEVDTGDCRSSRGKHGVGDEHLHIFDAVGQLAVIFHGLERLGVTVKADETDFGRRHKRKKPVKHTHSRAEYGNDGKAPVNDVYVSLSDRRLHLGGDKLDMPCGLVAQEHGNLGDYLLELLCACILISEHCHFVLDKWMI